MSAFLADYGLFLLKTLTLLAAVVAGAAAIAVAGRKATQNEGLEVEHLNDKYRKVAHGLRQAIASKAERKAQAKAEKEQRKAEEKTPRDRPRSFILELQG